MDQSCTRRRLHLLHSRPPRPRRRWDAVYNTSITPPLHYGLAWLSLKLGGDDTELVRLPSLIFGTALVPLVYAWTRRVGDSFAALLAALLITLSPFAIWYADEARAYATMMFLVALSTLALLRALDGRGRVWWLVHVICACAALWSHYTAVFVIVAQAAWAVWARRDQIKELLIAQAIIAIGYLPWLPGFIEQRQNKDGVLVIGEFGPVNFESVIEIPLRVLIGHPYLGLRDAPGWKALVLAAAGLLLVAGALTVARSRPPSPARLIALARSEIGLLALLSVATPAGLLLYSIASSSLWLPRNLAPSVPAAAVLAGALVVTAARLIPRPLGAVAVGTIIAFSSANAIQTVSDDDFRRPPFREAAEYVDRKAAPGDPVVETTLALAPDPRLPPITLDRYFEEPRRIYRSRAGDARAWRALQRGRDLFAITPRLWIGSEFVQAQLQPGEKAGADQLRRLDSVGGPDGRAIVSSLKTFPGVIPVVVLRYRGMLSGRIQRRDRRENISWTRGAVPVTPGAANGEVQSVAPPGEPLQVAGWALDPVTRRPADWVLLFVGDRLAAVAAGGVRRPDIAAREGPPALLSGFGLAPSQDFGADATLRVFAVVGRRASSSLQPGCSGRAGGEAHRRALMAVRL